MPTNNILLLDIEIQTKEFGGWVERKLTDLSPSCSTLHGRNVVWPTLAVTFRGTSKLKNGCKDIVCSGCVICSPADTWARSEK